MRRIAGRDEGNEAFSFLRRQSGQRGMDSGHGFLQMMRNSAATVQTVGWVVADKADNGYGQGNGGPHQRAVLLQSNFNPMRWATVCISLSPRPDRLASTILSLGSVAASLAA